MIEWFGKENYKSRWKETEYGSKEEMTVEGLK